MKSTTTNDASTMIKEGLAQVCIHHKQGEKSAAFYNEAQVVNRDLSITMVQRYVDECRKRAGAAVAKEDAGEVSISYLEALSASGLRAIRMAKETKGLTRIVANDMESIAVEQIRANLALNGLLEGKNVEVSCADALDVMYSHRAAGKRFDVVDLDPYGSPGIFLDGAVQCVKDGGLLMVTCTDLLTLCGSQPEVCNRKYGAVSLKAKCSHEIAIRIALGAIALRAQTYGRHIEPLCSLMIDFYVRVFVRVQTNGRKAMQQSTQMGSVWVCGGCHNFETVTSLQNARNNDQKYVSSSPPADRDCAHCGTRLKMGGPLWLGPLHDEATLEGLQQAVKSNGATLASQRKLSGILSMAISELVDVPLFHELPDLCNVIHCNMPSSHAFRSALCNAGYSVSGVHMSATGFKTNAPMVVIWDILRVWKAKHSSKNNPPKPNSPAAKIMATEPTTQVDFTLVPEAKLATGTRFVKVPGWGPKTKGIQGSRPNVNASEPDQKKSRIAEQDEDEGQGKKE